ncbi:hypothetical protein OH77DRAFT_1155730 [Trametes cingulata]|nr:hypothetical protein OH77DRAFT_1155730 [Trametes cingulata]
MTAKLRVPPRVFDRFAAVATTIVAALLEWQTVPSSRVSRDPPPEHARDGDVMATASGRECSRRRTLCPEEPVVPTSLISTPADTVPSGEQAVLRGRSARSVGSRSDLTRRAISDPASIGIWTAVGVLLFLGLMIVLIRHLFATDKRRSTSGAEEGTAGQTACKPERGSERYARQEAAGRAGSTTSTTPDDDVFLRRDGINPPPRDARLERDVPEHGFLENPSSTTSIMDNLILRRSPSCRTR